VGVRRGDSLAGPVAREGNDSAVDYDLPWRCVAITQGLVSVTATQSESVEP